MQKLPFWLIKRTPKQHNIRKLRSLVNDPDIHTVCESAKCPNIGECYSCGTMTFMILGDVCTRNCAFCAVAGGKPSPLDETEPKRVAEAAKKLGLKYVVITSVTRDDLLDGGAGQFAKTIKEIRDRRPETGPLISDLRSPISIEVLIPDFKGSVTSLQTVIAARPDVINHNVETVPRLYSAIRPQASYNRSLELLYNVKGIDENICTKSGLMVGFGESFGEVADVLRDLKRVNCDIVTIGQYLPPSREHAALKEHVEPETFSRYEALGLEMGFKSVFSGPFVRSSYQAHKLLGRTE